MTELTVVDLLRSNRALRRADVLTVAEILAHHLAQEHVRGRWHGDIGPHTVVLTLTDPPPGATAGAHEPSGITDLPSPLVQDAWLAEPHPAARPGDWPVAPEGLTLDGPGDIFALGQVLRSLDARARSSAEDTDLPPFVWELIDADPARRPTARALLRAFDEGLIRPALTHPDGSTTRPDSTHRPHPAPPLQPAPSPELVLSPESAVSPAPALSPDGDPTPGRRVAESPRDSATRLPSIPSGTPPRSTWPLALAAVAIFALVLGTGLWWSGQGDPAPSVRAVSGGVDQAALVSDGDQDPASAGGSGIPPESTSAGEGTAGTDSTTATPTSNDAAERSNTGGGDPESSRTRPDVTFPSGTRNPPVPGMVAAAEAPVAEGATEFDQAWCRAHGTFVARARTDSFEAVICRDADTFNYHGLNLTDGRPIRTPAAVSVGGWTGLGEEDITYEVSAERVTVRDGDGVVLASEDVFAFLNDSSVGTFRPGDLMLSQPNSYPACDGSALVVIDTFYGRPDLGSAISRSLATNPGSAYLNTTTSCDSLDRPSYEISGTGEIYLTYYVVPGDRSTACAAIEAAGTHGFWLRDDVAPGERIECG